LKDFSASIDMMIFFLSFLLDLFNALLDSVRNYFIEDFKSMFIRDIDL
jgi:hypothetical protein